MSSQTKQPKKKSSCLTWLIVLAILAVAANYLYPYAVNLYNSFRDRYALREPDWAAYDAYDKEPPFALIKINVTNLPFVVFGNSDSVKVGEWVLAVGNPFNLTSTVTAGIISAKGRNINILGGGASIESFIQTDAAVNPGNSGGALVNSAGELVGINTAIITESGNYEGYSFAVPPI